MKVSPKNAALGIVALLILGYGVWWAYDTSLQKGRAGTLRLETRELLTQFQKICNERSIVASDMGNPVSLDVPATFATLEQQCGPGSKAAFSLTPLARPGLRSYQPAIVNCDQKSCNFPF